MTYENFIKAKLLQYVYGEAAHHGGTQGALAVAQVLANRVAAGWGDWNEVIDAAPKFIGTTPPCQQPINVRDLTFRRLLTMIDDVYFGTADATIINIEDDRGRNQAMYYAELHNIDRDWFRENISSQIERHARLATVGPLTFFA